MRGVIARILAWIARIRNIHISRPHWIMPHIRMSRNTVIVTSVVLMAGAVLFLAVANAGNIVAFVGGMAQPSGTATQPTQQSQSPQQAPQTFRVAFDKFILEIVVRSEGGAVSVTTPSPSPTTTATATPSATPTTAANTPRPTSTPTPAPTPTVAPTSAPTAPVATATPTPTARPSATATPSPAPTATPAPTAAPTPSPTPTPTPDTVVLTPGEQRTFTVTPAGTQWIFLSSTFKDTITNGCYRIVFENGTKRNDCGFAYVSAAEMQRFKLEADGTVTVTVRTR